MKARFAVVVASTMLGLVASGSVAQATTFPANGGTLGLIPDGVSSCAGPGAPLDVTFTVTGQPPFVIPSNVAVDMTFSPNHTWVGHLTATLFAPGGVAAFPIFGRTGATTAMGFGDSSDAAGPYTFIDSAPAAPTWWTAAAAVPFDNVVASGSYRASQVGGVGSTGANTLITPAFAALTDANGTWTLRFVNGCSGSQGAVAAANLTIGVGGEGTPPAPPSLTSTNPASPANNNTPLVIGTAEAGSTVKLYSNNLCTGAPLVSGTAANLAAPGLQINVADNTTTQVKATATDAANNVSTCSPAITYTEDSSPPAVPALTSTNPASPANNNTPLVIGTAEAGSTVKLYPTAGCTGPELAGTAANLAAPGIQINVADNTTTQVKATATDGANNTSPCSPAITYIEDSSPPAAPVLTSTNPASPANNNTPRVIGTAEAGSTVKLYPTAGCTGTPLATGTAANLAAPGLQITVADNTTTQVKATATDATNNVSPCSAAISYQELTPSTPVKDTTPPKTTITKSPKAKSKSKSATFEFTADEAGVKFDCKLEGKKVKPPLNVFAPCASPQTYTKLKPGKKTFTVHATDAAGNLGTDASFSFTVKKKRK